jgi:neutral ceramidase
MIKINNYRRMNAYLRCSLGLLAVDFKMAGLICLLFLSINDLKAQAQIFKAGASITNITPGLGGGIIGNFGNPPPAQHIHDQLHVRSLVLDDGATQLVFVVIDNLHLDREALDEAKKAIHEKTNLPLSNLLMSATHTHSATSATKAASVSSNSNNSLADYRTFLISRIVDGVQIALNNLEPARIGWGVGSVPQHVFNRRWKMKSPVVNPFGEKDLVRMNPGVGNPDIVEPAGPTDPEVSFISVQAVDGRPLALLANYSLHYVGGVPKNDISADYFAVFADRMQELLGADRQDPLFVGMMSNGTSGDINNINFRGPAEKNQPYAKMQVVANDVAEEVFKVYKTIEHKDWVPLKAEQSELRLEVRKPSPDLLAHTQKVLARGDDEDPLHHPLERTYAERIMTIEKDWPDRIDIVMQAFRIGDLAIAAIPFETFVEIGLELKNKSPFKQSFTISLANGGYGYLPTPEQHEMGGYETWLGTNRVEKNASRKIVSEILGLFSKLK